MTDSTQQTVGRPASTPSAVVTCSAACQDIDWVIAKLETHVWMTERAPKNLLVLPNGAQMKLLIARLKIAKLRLPPNDHHQRCEPAAEGL